MRENFECANCMHLGPLNVHGRCERCDSDAVHSHHIVDMSLGMEPLPAFNQ